MIDLLWTLGRYFLLFSLLLLLYVVYVLFINPYSFKRKFAKYANVYVDPQFNPLLGDMKYAMDSMQKDRVFYAHIIEKASLFSKYDMRVVVDGVAPSIHFMSPKAIKECIELMPTKIDRSEDDIGIGKIVPESLLNKQSAEDFIKRRKTALTVLSLNSASGYAP